jgi:hypothetical protein
MNESRLRTVIVITTCLLALAMVVDAPAQTSGPPPGQVATDGIEAPPRDTSKLASTFAEAVSSQPVDKSWPQAYKPQNRRDFTGMWLNEQKEPAWVPGNGYMAIAKDAPYTPEYAAIYKKRQIAAAEGKPIDDPPAACLPPGLPRIMTGVYGLEIVMNPEQVNMSVEFQEQQRRIFTDGRPLDPDPDPTYIGQSVGHWEGDILIVTSFGVRGDMNLDASGLPFSDRLIVHERMWLSDDNTFNDEITLVDPKALTRPWTVTKRFKRAEPGFTPHEYVCLENNRNPIAPDGTILTILPGKK